jgi:two-component system alkaline phosphatase synthesis response regulator PhoP
MAKILIVEDEQLIVEFVEFLLRQEGFEPLIARDGDVVLAMVRQERPDLVLLDLLLPTVDGFEVLRQLKEAPDSMDIPVIAFTARNRDADIALAFEMGVADYVCKPFSPTELMARIQRTLRPFKPRGTHRPQDQ